MLGIEAVHEIIARRPHMRAPMESQRSYSSPARPYLHANQIGGLQFGEIHNRNRLLGSLDNTGRYHRLGKVNHLDRKQRLFSRIFAWPLVLVIPRFPIGACIVQYYHYFQILMSVDHRRGYFLHRQMQRRPAVSIRGVHVCARPNQERDSLRLSRNNRVVEGSSPVFALRIPFRPFR